MPVEVGKAKEWLDIFDFLGFQPLLAMNYLDYDKKL